MRYNVPFNHSSQRGMTFLIASLSRIMTVLYLWAAVPRGETLSSCQLSDCLMRGCGGYWECQCTTQDAVMMSLRDRETVAWVPVQLEQQGVVRSNPDPLCYRSKYTPSPTLQYTHPAADSPSSSFCPFFSPQSPRPTASPDKQGTLIIPFPIINICCFHTMGPKESCRQQRKHLLLSRQGANSRILESVSYIPSVKNTHTQPYAHTYSMYVDIQTITSSWTSSL